MERADARTTALGATVPGASARDAMDAQSPSRDRTAERRRWGAVERADARPVGRFPGGGRGAPVPTARRLRTRRRSAGAPLRTVAPALSVPVVSTAPVSPPPVAAVPHPGVPVRGPGRVWARGDGPAGRAGGARATRVRVRPADRGRRGPGSRRGPGGAAAARGRDALPCSSPPVSSWPRRKGAAIKRVTPPAGAVPPRGPYICVRVTLRVDPPVTGTSPGPSGDLPGTSPTLR